MSFEDAYERGVQRAKEARAQATEDEDDSDVVKPLGAYAVERAAADAHEAGLCVIRAAVDGTKKPLGEWKRWQSERPSAEQVADWFGEGHRGMGLVTGKVSGNLELLEFEGLANTSGVVTKFKAAIREAGLGAEWERIREGYSERTPGDGFHVLWRCEEIGGNTKLARRPSATTGEVDVLIETRGEGGFVICAPSWGDTHPTGKPWVRRHGSFATIATIHPELRNRILELARGFDELPDEEPERAKPVGEKGDGGTLPGFDLTHEQTLKDAGFELHHVDRKGNAHWTRPNKALREGSSLTVWADDGRATPWSTSINAPGEFLTGARLLTPWQLHVALSHYGDFAEAARAWRREHGPEVGTFVPPPEFWEARPLLAHVQAFARARRCSPWAVLGVVLTRIAAAVPPFVTLPPLVGGHLSLNIYLGLVGKSGAGKDAATAAAQEAYDVGRIKMVGLGSGEGLLDQYVSWKPGKNGEDGTLERHTDSVLFTAPEIESLGALKGRSSATLMPELRKAWMGLPLGFAYANRERRLFLDPQSYRLCLIVGIQPEHSHVLLDEAAGGTPQRFLWMPAMDPQAPDSAPDEPETIDPLRLPKRWPAAHGGLVTLEVCATARVAVDEARIARLRDEGEALDGHALACRLKVAAVLGLADGRVVVSEDDWTLAETIQAVSDQTRALAAAAVGEVSKRSNRARGEARAEQQIIVAERVRDHDTETLERVAEVLLGELTDEWVARSRLRGFVTSRDRDRFDDAMACLIEGGQAEAEETEYRSQTGVRYRRLRGGQ